MLGSKTVGRALGQGRCSSASEAGKGLVQVTFVQQTTFVQGPEGGEEDEPDMP